MKPKRSDCSKKNNSHEVVALRNCPGGKVSYPSRRIARRYSRAHGARFGQQFGVYRCRTCGNYHLTSQRKVDS
jgi:hypothetical protein